MNKDNKNSKIIIVGDLFPVRSNIKRFTEGDVQYIFGDKICQLFSNANYRICNLEGALTDGQERCEKTGPVITAPTQAIEAYKRLGIDCCMLANNHITDGGHQGVLSTIHTLEEAGVQYVGAGINERSIRHYVKMTVGDKSVCIYNVCETMYNKPTANKGGAWLYDEYVVCKELEALRRGCDYLIVIYHGGIEKFRYPSPEMKKRFHRMADSGADVVLAQHTHCIGCEEYYGGAYLLYGQGDFLLNNFRPEITDKGLVIEIVIDKQGISVQKHMVKCSGDLRLTYVDNPNYKDFHERSRRVQENEYLHRQFQLFCEQELQLYLTAFKSPGKILRIMRRIFPSAFKKWLFHTAFSRRNLMFSLHTLRSEQNRETAIAGIENLLNLAEMEVNDEGN